MYGLPPSAASPTAGCNHAASPPLNMQIPHSLEHRFNELSFTSFNAHLKSAAITPAKRPLLRKRREKRPDPQLMSTSVCMGRMQRHGHNAECNSMGHTQRHGAHTPKVESVSGLTKGIFLKAQSAAQVHQRRQRYMRMGRGTTLGTRWLTNQPQQEGMQRVALTSP